MALAIAPVEQMLSHLPNMSIDSLLTSKQMKDLLAWAVLFLRSSSRLTLVSV